MHSHRSVYNEGGRHTSAATQDEHHRLTQLTEAYGVDLHQRDSRVSSQQPSKLRAHLDLSLSETNPILDVPKRGDNAIIGRELVAQMMLAHLTLVHSQNDQGGPKESAASSSSPLPPAHGGGGDGGSVVDALRQEMKSFGLGDAYYLSTLSPIPFLPTQHPSGPGGVTFSDLGSPSVGGASPSPLVLLLAPHRATAAALHHLNASMRESVMLSCPAIALHPSALRSLEAAMTQPMWSEPPQDAFLLKRTPPANATEDSHQSDARATLTAARPRHKGKIVMATMNQLVEQLTFVYVNPLESLSQAAQDYSAAFTRAFFRTYRLFLAPQALLSKLIQRYFVPSSFYVSDHTDVRGIEFRAPPDMGPQCRTSFGGFEYTPRSAKWLRVSQLIKVKVLCVLSHWLRECPRHFDGQMLRIILSFLEEQCFHPTAHADCPAMIMQSAEFVKAAAVELLLCRTSSSATKGASSSSLQRSSGSRKSRGTLAWLPVGVRRSVPPSLLLYSEEHASSASFSPGTEFDRFVPASLVQRLVWFHAQAKRSKGVLLRSAAPTQTRKNVEGADRHAEEDKERDGAHRSTSSIPGFDAEVQRVVVDEFIQLSLPEVVRIISGCSQLLFRSFDVEELFELAILGGAAATHHVRRQRSAQDDDDLAANEQDHPGGGITMDVFIAHAERLMLWTSSLLLSAALLDISHAPSASVGHSATKPLHSSSTASSSPSYPLLEAALYRAVALATELIEANDLHSAFGIVAGLNHPAVARLHGPIFAKRFMFHERIETLIAFFDLSTSKYVHYMSNLPDDDANPPVPFVHQVLDEIRSLHETVPSFYRVPASLSASASGHRPPPPGQEGASCGSNWVASEVVVHWRKFQALEGMLEDIVKYQAAPVSHTTFADVQAIYDQINAASASVSHASSFPASQRGHKNMRASGRGPTTNSLAAVGNTLELSQWVPEHMITDASTLALMSLAVHDPSRAEPAGLAGPTDHQVR